MPGYSASAVKYYISSIPALLRRVDSWRILLRLAGRPVLLTTDLGLRFRVASLMDLWLLKEVVLDDQYQQRHAVNEGDTVVDIGAGIGDFSILASRKAGRVFAYERDSARAGLARANIRLNARQNIVLHQAEVRSLDQVFEENRIERCDFLKVDCEGCEYPIFANASAATLSTIQHIAMEVHLFTPRMRKDYRDLTALLIRNRFAIEVARNPVHSTLRLVYAHRGLRNTRMRRLITAGLLRTMAESGASGLRRATGPRYLRGAPQLRSRRLPGYRTRSMPERR
jgi:hypothetical protein